MNDTVEVNCLRCKAPIHATFDQLRAENDDGTPPPCPRCSAGFVRKVEPRLTAADVILIAAAELHAMRKPHGDPTEFSEFELTVAAWRRSPERFGLRGYTETHPDHKRVYMEIVGQKPSSPIVQGFMAKVRPNYYRLTPVGVVRAEFLVDLAKRRRK